MTKADQIMEDAQLLKTLENAAVSVIENQGSNTDPATAMFLAEVVLSSLGDIFKGGIDK